MQDRRKFLGLAAAAPFAAFTAGRALAADAACYNPATLPGAQKSLRASLEFKEVSGDPKKNCGGCAFYKTTAGNCGTCQLLSGPTNAGAVCSSWAAKG